jgi:NAD(P)-dependent dehydrogenase (short-subunit alcohol dehydrogenase family)
VEEHFGPIDIWINNAMTSVFAPFLEVEPAEFRRVTEVTYLGTVYGTMSALKRMAKRNRGTIVQVGSVLAYRSIPLQSAYCGAKHGIQGFTDSIRTELLHEDSQVQITTVQLPAVNTPQFEWVESRLPKHPQPVPPIYQPEIAARAVHWAAYNPRREMAVGWRSGTIIWLNKFFPGAGDRYLARTGYDGQQTDEPVEADRRGNLWEPVPGDFAAHGRFDDEATAVSPHLWVNMHRGWLTLAAVGVAGVAGLALARRRR